MVRGERGETLESLSVGLAAWGGWVVSWTLGAACGRDLKVCERKSDRMGEGGESA